MKKYMMIALSFLVFTPAAFAAASQFDCKPLHWPLTDLKKTPERVRAFRKTDRNLLIQYYFTELSDPKDPTLVHDLGAFLEGTEQDELMQGYYQVIENAATPDDGGPGVRALPFQELCDKYRMTLKGPSQTKAAQKNARIPASSK